MTAVPMKVGPRPMTPEEEVAVLHNLSGDPMCKAVRRIRKGFAQVCTLPPNHDGDHVDGVAVRLSRQGFIDYTGGFPPPVTDGAGPWLFVKRDDGTPV